MSSPSSLLIPDRPSDLKTEVAEHGDVAPSVPASSPFATATAVSALLLAEQHDISFSQLQAWKGKEAPVFDTAYQGDLSELIVTSLHWLAHEQHSDGGWGEGDASDLATTLLVRAAFQITGVPVQYADLVQRADAYVLSQGGIPALKTQCGNDRIEVAPILANCAMAGSLPWKCVPSLPFELAFVPTRWTRSSALPTARYASPLAVAIGLAKSFHRPSRNPVTRVARRWAQARALAKLCQLQPTLGGFLDSIPTTSFVVMSLASMGHAHLPIVRRGVEFLFATLRSDGSWPSAANPSVTTATAR